MKYILVLCFFFVSQNSISQEICINNNCILELSNSIPENQSLSVLGRKLSVCSQSPLTGFYRDGYCKTGIEDKGNHSVCAVMTDKFLNYMKQNGNDLITPNKYYNFPGLKSGDKWCLCASRWFEAKNNGIVTKVDLDATHERSTDVVRNFNLTWKKRAILCSKTFFNNQASVLNSDQSSTKDLRLVLLLSRNVNGCQLLGLDGGTKLQSNKFFNMELLKRTINMMPMRKDEIENN